MKEPPIIKPPMVNPLVKARRKRSLVRRFFHLAAAFGVLVLLGYLVFVPHPPKEAKLIRNFHTHRAAFEQLRTMLLADKNLRRVGIWGVHTDNLFYIGYPSPTQFPPDRYKQYLALLKQIGGGVAYRSEGEPACPGVVVWGSGWAGHIVHIEVCWLEETPTNQVPSLDGYRWRLAHGKQEGVYRHIDGNWYLWTNMRKSERQPVRKPNVREQP